MVKITKRKNDETEKKAGGTSAPGVSGSSGGVKITKREETLTTTTAYQRTVGATRKATEEPAVAVRKNVNVGYERSGKTRDQYDSDVRRRYAERIGVSGEGEKENTDFSVGKLLLGTTEKGNTRFLQRVADTASWLEDNTLGVLFPGTTENTPVKAFQNWTRTHYDDVTEANKANVEAGGKAAQIVDKYGESVVEAIPNAVLAYVTAGTSAAATTTTAGLEAAAAAAKSSPGILSALKGSAASMAKDPQYWASFFQEVGSNYEEAKANGASQAQANYYALATSLVNATVEIGGGIQTLPKELQGSRFTIKKWIESMLDEGKEEVVQGVISRAMENVAYDRGNALYAISDENAILNPKTAAEEFKGGAVVGGVLGGGQGIMSNLMQRNTPTPTAEQDTAKKPAVLAMSTPSTPVQRENTSKFANESMVTAAMTDPATMQPIAKTLGSNGQKAIFTAYHGETDTTAYSGDFVRVYNAAREGKKVPRTTSLTPAQVFAAESAGKNDAVEVPAEENISVQGATGSGTMMENSRIKGGILDGQAVPYGRVPGESAPVQRGERTGSGEDTRRKRTSETATDFSARNAAEGRTETVLGGRAYSFRRVDREGWSDYAKACAAGLEQLGLSAEVMDGNLRSNTGDITVETSGDAVTAVDGTVFIKNDTKGFTPQEIVGHEGFHAMLKQKRNSALEYQDSVMDQLKWGDPLVMEFVENITDNYFPNGFDLTDASQAAKFFDELSAYVSGMVNDGLDMSFLFRDYEPVQTALSAMMKGDTSENHSTISGTDGLGAADAGFDPYSQLQNQYGTIEPGEDPARSVDVPKKTSENEKVSQTVRTAMEAAVTTETSIPTIEKLVAQGNFSYEVYTDKQALEDATAAIREKGWDKSQREWFERVKSGIVSKQDTAVGWALYNNAATSGNVGAAMDVLTAMVSHQRNAAQAVQATRILKKLSPDAQLYGVQRSVEDLQTELNERYGDKKAPKLKIGEDLAKRFMEAKDQEARDAALRDIYRDIGRQMPSRFADKWNAWRYLAMLGNPRTHVRNIVGNLGFVLPVAGKNLAATAIESAVYRVSGGKLERTKGVVGIGKAGQALLKAAWADFSTVQETAMSGSKYGDFANANKYIEEGRVIFRSKVGKAVETARKTNSKVLDMEDAWFSQPHYAYAMAQYCQANGITAEQISKGDSAALAKARAYAVKEAQKATYRDTNAFSQAVGEWGRTVRTGNNPARKAVGLVLEGILPFRKTPANILARGVEYSPVGLLNGIKQAMWDVRKGTKTGAEAIDSISAGLTGTGLLALGVYLAAEGLVRGAGGGDDKEKAFEELQGHQDYALELPNGTSVTLDWLAPEALPFFVGVNLWETTKGEKEPVTFSAILSAISNVTAPLLEMSCLQSLNDVFDAVGYASSEGLDALPSALASAATSYVTQVFPTLFGQIERITEIQRETTYTEKNAFLTGDMQYTLGKISGKTPGEYHQIPYIDAWGRVESTGGVGERIFNNLINPAYTSKIVTSEMEEELTRLYEITGEGGVFPSRAAKYFVVNGERKDLTAEEYVQYATLKGQKSYELVTELIQSSQYQRMSEAEKVKAVKDAYDLANQEAKAIISSYETESWMQKAAEAEKKYHIKQDTFVALRARTSGIQSLKDQDGETIPDSKGLLIMQEVYNTPGLTDAQRKAMFEYLGVGKSVRHYNKALVNETLQKMKKREK